MNTTILLNFKTQRKCGQCKEFIVLEKEINNILYKGVVLFHSDCLKKKMLSRKTGKLSESDVDIIIEDLKLDSVKKIENVIYKNHLYKYLMMHYSIVMFPTYIYQKLEKIFVGEYKNMSTAIPAEHLLDMFQRKASYLDKLYHKEKMDGVARVNYDLAVLIARYSGYLDWLGKRDTEEKKIELYQKENISLTNLVPVIKDKNENEDDIFEE